MYSIERKSEILNLLEVYGSVNVAELAKLFNTSKETIRRDLRELEQQGALTRTHGGAIPLISEAPSDPNAESTYNNAPIPNEYPVSIRGIRHFKEKQQICKTAASFIQPGDTVFVDNSSTLIYLAQYVPAHIPVTFITNSLNFLLESAKLNNPQHLYVCLGGVFKSSNLSVHGNITLKNAQEYYPNKAFLSCTGISPQRMLTDSSIQEIAAKQLMMELSNEVFILADHSKFERNGQIFLSSFQNVTHVITDAATDTEKCYYLTNHNIDIIVANY